MAKTDRVLLIEGFSQCDPDSFMATGLAGVPGDPCLGLPDMRGVAKAAWKGARLERFYYGNASKAAVCAEKTARSTVSSD